MPGVVQANVGPKRLKSNILRCFFCCLIGTIFKLICVK
jgi:hypothetical protein